jgi:RND family efflux transporter MFP subunit
MKAMTMPRHFPLVSFLPVLASLGMLAGCSSSRPTAEAPTETVSGVQLETESLNAAPQTYEAVGTIRSANISVLNAQLGGTVRELRVRAGDRVRLGQVLAVIDDRAPRAQADAAQAAVLASSQERAQVEQSLAAATAERQFAEATYHRYQTLLQKKSLSHQEFEGAEAKYKAAVAAEQAAAARRKEMDARDQQARAQKTSAETILSYSRILAPSDGVISQRSVDPGTVVMPGTPILTIEETSHYRLEANVPEEFLPDVQVGQTVSVSTARGTVQGRTAEIVPTSDPASRTFLVKIDLPSGPPYQSGEYAKAAFPVGEQRILTVPSTALVTYGELEGVFVADANGVLQYQLVKTGKSSGDRVEILSGLSNGDRVAVTDTAKLRDGMRVEGQ